MRIPYTYLIGWKSLNKYYYGVQYGKHANPKNLWTTYFTSSTYVKELRDQHGEPDVVQVRQCFTKINDAIDWEGQVLRRMKCSGKLVNRLFCSIADDFHGEMHLDHKKKIGDANRGQKRKPLSDEHKRKIAESRQHTSDEMRQKLSDALKGKKRQPFSEEWKLNMSAAQKGKKLSEETRKKMSESRKGCKRGPVSEETKRKISETKRNQGVK